MSEDTTPLNSMVNTKEENFSQNGDGSSSEVKTPLVDALRSYFKINGVEQVPAMCEVRQIPG